MTRTNNSIILEDDIWADNGDTTSPPFAPDIGWDITYSQPGGNVVQRTLMNYNFNQLTGLGYDLNRYGGNLFWDVTIEYEIGAVVIASDNIRYISSTQNTGNDPVSDGGVNWAPVAVTFANDSNVTINTDAATNTVTIGLVEDLSNKANTDLSNVPIANFASKLKDGQYTYKEIDVNQVKINVYEILTDSNISFSVNAPSQEMTFATTESLADLKSNYTSSSEPSPTVPGQFWNDDNRGTLFIRNLANNAWSTVSNSDTYHNLIGSGIYHVSSLDNAREYVLLNFGTGSDNPVTLQLPAFSSIADDFIMTFVSRANSDITVTAFPGEQLYRNDTLANSFTVTNQENAIFSIIKIGGGNFFFIGAEKSIDDNLSNITLQGQKNILDLLMPVGYIWTSALNVTPPLSGQLGVTWSLIDANRCLVTSGLTTGGTIAGAQALNSTLSASNNTEGHAVTIAEMPSHTHTMGIWKNHPEGGPTAANPAGTTLGFFGTNSGAINPTGSNAAHSHKLNVKSYSVVTYRRIS